MSRRRIKLNMYDLYEMGIDWFESHRVHDRYNNYGTRFVLDKQLTSNQLDTINNYKNVIINECYYRYAPEIKHTTIILMDKCIKKVVKNTWQAIQKDV